MRNKILFAAIIGLSCTTLSSCQKKDNETVPKAPITNTPTPSSVETYVIENTNSNSYNVDDTIYVVNANTVTIPLNYGQDTIHLTTDSVQSNKYWIDHVVKNNTQYHLVGNFYKLSATTIMFTFGQRIAPYNSINTVQNYNLQYTKL